MNRKYEAILVVQPSAEEAAVSKLIEQFSELVHRHEGTVLHHAVWGKRKLSYRLKRQGEGIYVKIQLEASPQAVASVRKSASLMESVLRLMIVEGFGSSLSLDTEKDNGEFEQGVLNREPRSGS